MTEYFDVLDADGNFTGEMLPRDEVHARGLWHGSVHVWVMNGAGQLLLQQRAAGKTDPNLWDMSVCGHIASGDDPITTAIREAEEELALTLDPANFDELLLYVHENVHPLADGTVRHERLITPTFVVRREVDLDSLRLEPREVQAVRWIDFDELHTAVSNPPHNYSIRPDEWAELFPELKKRMS